MAWQCRAAGVMPRNTLCWCNAWWSKQIQWHWTPCWTANGMSGSLPLWPSWACRTKMSYQISTLVEMSHKGEAIDRSLDHQIHYAVDVGDCSSCCYLLFACNFWFYMITFARQLGLHWLILWVAKVFFQCTIESLRRVPAVAESFRSTTSQSLELARWGYFISSSAWSRWWEWSEWPRWSGSK